MQNKQSLRERHWLICFITHIWLWFDDWLMTWLVLIVKSNSVSCSIYCLRLALASCSDSTYCNFNLGRIFFQFNKTFKKSEKMTLVDWAPHAVVLMSSHVITECRGQSSVFLLHWPHMPRDSTDLFKPGPTNYKKCQNASLHVVKAKFYRNC